MPLTASIRSGNLIHRPITKQLTYLGHNYQQFGGVANASASISCPSIGPNRTLYVCAITTRGSAGSGWQAPTFNGRTMTELVNSGTNYTKPTVWFSIALNNNETSGSFVWRETQAVISSMAHWAYQSRGMRSVTPYHTATGAGGGTTSGFVTQEVSTNFNFPASDYAILLFNAVKGINDSGDSSSFQNTNLSSIFTNTRYTMSSSNSMHVFAGYTALTNTNLTQYTGTFFARWTTNTIPVANGAGLVIY